jgi:hypothetical protein
MMDAADGNDMDEDIQPSALQITQDWSTTRAQIREAARIIKALRSISQKLTETNAQNGEKDLDGKGLAMLAQLFATGLFTPEHEVPIAAALPPGPLGDASQQAHLAARRCGHCPSCSYSQPVSESDVTVSNNTS